MYQLAISRDFIAQHFLVGGDWGRENQQHSHHYRVEVLIRSKQLDRHGYLIDLVDLEKALEEVIETYRERTLNDLPAFQGLNPSLEHFSRIFWEALNQRLNLDGAMTLKVWENETDWAGFSIV